MHAAAGVDIAARGPVEVRWAASAGPAVEPARERAVGEVWERALRERGGALHDSPILVFRRIEREASASVVHGAFVPYRYYFARRELENVGVQADPIGVNGLTFITEGSRRMLVLGRRSRTVAWYPGQWECVPSGGLDRRGARPDGGVDFAALLREEFEEELCISASRAQVGESFGLVYDRATHTYDVCCLVTAGCSRAELAAAVGQSREYSALMFVAEHELTQACEQLGESLIPTARAMIDLFGEVP